MSGDTAKSIRGEVPVEVCGRQLTIAPTFRAIEAIEVRLGVGIPHLLARCLSGDIRIHDLAVIVYEGIKGAGHHGRNGTAELISRDEIGEDVLQNLSLYATAVGKFLGNALGGTDLKKDSAPPLATTDL